jgi:hypothetical protein
VGWSTIAVWRDSSDLMEPIPGRNKKFKSPEELVDQKETD